MKHLIVAVAVLALVLAACGEATLAERTTTTGADLPTTTGGAPVGDFSDEVAALLGVTAELRGLEYLDPVEVTVLSTEELATRVAADVAEQLDPADVEVDQALYRLIGILPTGLDLRQALLDLYAEQVAGFYDDDTGELVVAAGDTLTPMSRVYLVHELIHALTDQHYGVAAEFQRLVDADRHHEASALLALAEGDATYFMILYLQGMSADDQVTAALESLDADTTVVDSLPDWFAEDLVFAYNSGFGFVERLVADRGLGGLNRAYDLIPTTVEQILHPAAYFALEPSREVALPETTVAGYAVHREGEFGEWNLQLFLLEGIPDGAATIAAAGWGGDAYRILWDGTNVAFAYLYEGDTPRDAEELEAALVDSIRANMAAGNGSTDTASGSTLFERNDFAFVQRDGSRVLVIAADDIAVGRELADQLRFEIDAGTS